MRPDANWLETLPKSRLMAEMSLWSADLGNMSGEIDRVDAFTDLFHIDVADGVFSPSLLFFPDLVAAVRKKTARPLHVHLMVSDAILLSQIEQFAEAGADLISLHAENANATQGLALIAELGLHAGLVLQVHTPVQVAAAFLEKISFLTLLGTQIGVKGQALNPEANGRLAQARLLIGKSLNARGGHRLVLAADGGIREHTVPGLRQSGAQTIVMGSLAFGARNLKETMSWVHAHGSGM